ncbi:MAG TPA: serine hydrolase domain-containing protein [Candidatus Bathyarchaeia archaeon]|nr:serine hydrolase domain-containing protein [Candidatus Bathyarchaeia archaeon]
MTKGNLIKKLRLYLEEQSKIDNFSGTVLVAKDGQPVLEYTSGFANKESHLVNKINTKFSLGSVNKIFTGVAIAQLVEKGLLKFDDIVGKYLPDYPNPTVKKQVTIHHLLTHTSGLGHYPKDWDKLKAFRESLRSISDFVGLFKDKPLLFRPGAKYQYSADGYELLGAIIEATARQNYYDYVADNIFHKAGMPNTDFYEIDRVNLNPNVAIGYKKTRDSFFSPSKAPPENNLAVNLIKGSAAGGGYSTVYDLFHFSQALLEHRLLSHEMTCLVTTPQVKIETVETQTLYYGYGFQIVDFAGQYTRIGHGGAFAGVNARLDIYKEPVYTVIVLSNYDRPTAFRVAGKAEKLITMNKML